MKKTRFYLCILLLVVAVAANAQSDVLTILHLNDTHSALAPTGPRTPLLQGTQGGIARAASVIGYHKQTEPNVLALHAGDVFIGDLFFNQYFGAAEFQLMSAIGFDAMTVGNHEFDLYPSTLLMALEAAQPTFPLLTANVNFDDSTIAGIKQYIQPYTIKDFGTIKVGIFGLTTPEAKYFSNPAPAVMSEDVAAAAVDMVSALAAENCDIILCLSHLGYTLDRVLAENIPGITAIIGGHDHYLFEEPVEVDNPSGKKTWIVQAGSFFSHIGKLQLEVKPEGVEFVGYELIKLDQNIPEEPNTATAVNDLIAGIEATYGPLFTQQVGFSTAFFNETADSLLFKGPHDTPAGNLVADAFRNKTGTDIAIEVGGSTAQPLHEGPLVGADLFRVCGYGFNEVNGLGFRIATFNMTGAALWQALETVLASIEANDEYLPQVSGMRYQYDATMPPGSRVVYVEINGAALDPGREYSMTGNEFLLYAVENVFGIPVSDAYVLEDSTEFQVLLEYVLAQPNQTVSPYTDGRVYNTTTVVDTKEADALAHTLQLDQNYPNPVTTGTRIRWHQPEGGFTTLSVFDLTGKEVATPVRGYLSSGTHDVYWPTGELHSGLYYYTLTTGVQRASRKLLVVRQ